MQLLASRKSRKVFFVTNLLVEIISGAASFLFALFVLAQFEYVERVFRLEFGLLANALIELLRFLIASWLFRRKIDFHILKDKSTSERQTLIVKTIMYLLKLATAIVIIFLARFGGLEKIEYIPLSGEPTAIAYMVFVFFAIFLNMFSIYIALVFSSETSSVIKGRKVRFITEQAIGTQSDGISYPLNYGRLGGMSDYCERASAFLLGVDTAVEYYEGVIAALLVGGNGEESWIVTPANRYFRKKEIEKQMKFYGDGYRIKTGKIAIEFYCFVNKSIER